LGINDGDLREEDNEEEGDLEETSHFLFEDF